MFSYEMFSQDLVNKLLQLREDVLGPEHFALRANPMSHDGKFFFQPTLFETLGANSVKKSRCYSTSMTHQHPRALVGPTAGVKVYSEGMKDNEILRKRVVEVSKILLATMLPTRERLYLKVNAEATMIVLKEFVPKTDLNMLNASTEYNNLPRIGTDENTAFPALQINLAGAVAYSDAYCKPSILKF